MAASRQNGAGRGNATVKVPAGDSGGHDLAKRLEKVEKEIAAGENTVRLRRQDLDALTPRFDQIDTQCQQEFGCGVGALDAVLAAKEAELAHLITELESDLQRERAVEDAPQAATAGGAGVPLK